MSAPPRRLRRSPKSPVPCPASNPCTPRSGWVRTGIGRKEGEPSGRGYHQGRSQVGLTSLTWMEVRNPKSRNPKEVRNSKSEWPAHARTSKQLGLRISEISRTSAFASRYFLRRLTQLNRAALVLLGAHLSLSQAGIPGGAQVSQPAVSPTSSRLAQARRGRPGVRRVCGLEIRDPADWKSALQHRLGGPCKKMRCARLPGEGTILLCPPTEVCD